MADVKVDIQQSYVDLIEIKVRIAIVPAYT